MRSEIKLDLLVIEEAVGQVDVDGENSSSRQDIHHGGSVFRWNPFDRVRSREFSSDGHARRDEPAGSISSCVGVRGLEGVTTTRSQIIPSVVFPSAGATAAGTAFHYLLFTIIKNLA